MHAGGRRGAFLINSHQGGCLRVLATAELAIAGADRRGRAAVSGADDCAADGCEAGDGISDGRQERSRGTPGSTATSPSPPRQALSATFITALLTPLSSSSSSYSNHQHFFVHSSCLYRRHFARQNSLSLLIPLLSTFFFLLLWHSGNVLELYITITISSKRQFTCCSVFFFVLYTVQVRIYTRSRVVSLDLLFRCHVEPSSTTRPRHPLDPSIHWSSDDTSNNNKNTRAHRTARGRRYSI